VWGPLVEAVELGLWAFWVLSDEIIAVPRPDVHLEGGKLHREDGPAIQWPGGARYWYWRGVRVDEAVVLDPRSIRLKDILDELNVEKRRVLLERYGQGRFLAEMKATIVDSDPDIGVLYRREISGDEPLVMVKVRNTTPEPDGSHRDYWLRVPPATQTAREGVAWTFGLEPDEYAPLAQS
jgi:hypothetical protein